MPKIVPFIAFFTLVLFSCSDSESKTNDSENIVAEEPADSKLYESDKFSVKYSEEYWTLDNSGVMGTSLILFDISSGSEFKNNINVYIEDLTGKNIDLDMYTEISKSQLAQYITNYQNVASERKEINGEKCQVIIYTGTQGMHQLKWKQHYYIKEDKAYVVTFTCVKEDYDSKINLADAVMATLKIK